MIPKALLVELSGDPYYRQCAVTGSFWGVQWHHVFMFGGKSIQERWAIIPLKAVIHRQVTQHNPEYDPGLAERVEWMSLNRATEDELQPYSKVVDLVNLKKELNRKYGSYYVEGKTDFNQPRL
jgi:hypothetical protein